MTVHHFNDKLAQGESYEAYLDGVFRSWGYVVDAVDRFDQRRGIDRVMFNPRTGETTAVEYKADSMAQKTGNAFVETISVDTTGKRGWAYTSQADYLAYYIPGDGLLYLMAFTTLRAHLPRWQATYRPVGARNDGYMTRGIAVPLREFEQHAESVINLG